MPSQKSNVRLKYSKKAITPYGNLKRTPLKNVGNETPELPCLSKNRSNAKKERKLQRIMSCNQQSCVCVEFVPHAWKPSKCRECMHSSSSHDQKRDDVVLVTHQPKNPGSIKREMKTSSRVSNAKLLINKSPNKLETNGPGKLKGRYKWQVQTKSKSKSKSRDQAPLSFMVKDKKKNIFEKAVKHTPVNKTANKKKIVTLEKEKKVTKKSVKGKNDKMEARNTKTRKKKDKESEKREEETKKEIRRMEEKNIEQTEFGKTFENEGNELQHYQRTMIKRSGGTFRKYPSRRKMLTRQQEEKTKKEELIKLIQEQEIKNGLECDKNTDAEKLCRKKKIQRKKVIRGMGMGPGMGSNSLMMQLKKRIGKNEIIS